MSHEKNEAIFIRYGCPCGKYEPLSMLFYSDDCQKLVCRSPSCSIQEFESYYCGYLLINMPSKEASMYQNRSSRCFSCVCCGNVLSTVYNDLQSTYMFLCSHCRWDSVALGLVDDDPDMLVMSAIARERECPQEDVFNVLVSHHSTHSTASRASITATNPTSFSSSSSFPIIQSSRRSSQMTKSRLQRLLEMGEWKQEHIEKKLQETAQWQHQQAHEHWYPPLKSQLTPFPVHNPMATEEQEMLEILETLATNRDILNTTSTLKQRLLNPLEQPRDVSQVFPVRPPLRVKRTWRCVESMARGSPGILVKPHISPMSGDSSLPIPASWFKKENLATRFYPTFTFQQLPIVKEENGGVLECVLRVENPRDEGIRMVCRPLIEGELLSAQVVIEDLTPVVVSGYEDSNLSLTMSATPRVPATSMETRNKMVVDSDGNVVKLRLCLQMKDHEVSSGGSQRVCFGVQIEMERLESETNESIPDSLTSFSVQFQSYIG